MKAPEEKDPIPVKSSLLQAYSYDDKTHVLSVTFRDGTNVEYSNVMPPAISKVFDTGGSLGSKFVKQIVKGNYTFKVV